MHKLLCCDCIMHTPNIYCINLTCHACIYSITYSCINLTCYAWMPVYIHTNTTYILRDTAISYTYLVKSPAYYVVCSLLICNQLEYILSIHNSPPCPAHPHHITMIMIATIPAWFLMIPCLPPLPQRRDD